MFVCAGVVASQDGHVGTLGIVGLVLLGAAYLGPWLSLIGLVVEIDIADKCVEEDEPTMVRVSIRNRLPVPIWGAWLALGNELQIHGTSGSSVALDSVNAFGRRAFDVPITAARRGVYPKQPPEIGSGFPFGLQVRTRILELPQRLTVWPKVFETARLPLMGHDAQVQQEAIAVRAGHDGDYFGLREYRRGEPLGQVHWPATARRDKLIVREREELPTTSITIALDIGAAWDESPRDADAFDWAVRTVASLTRTCLKAGHQVSVWLGDSNPIMLRWHADLPRLLDRLTLLEPTSPTLSAAPASADRVDVWVTHGSNAARRESRIDALRIVFGCVSEQSDQAPIHAWRRIDQPEQTPEILGTQTVRGVHAN
jgi:uncharacterized protein (DUF58 family)